MSTRLLACVAVALTLFAPAAEGLQALRVCADPDNLPFSRAEGPERGLYIDLAELLAAKLGTRAEYAWFASYYGRRAVRTTLLSDRCDAYVGLPDDAGFMGRSVERTRAFLDVGYAIMAPKGLAFGRLDDLKGKALAVQFGTEPQMLLATREGFRVSTFRLAEEAIEALTRREVDAAFLWGPIAGYHNRRRLGGAYAVVPVAGPGLQWQAGIGVRKGEHALKARLDQALTELAPDIRRLADAYGFPQGPPVALDGAASAPSPAGGVATRVDAAAATPADPATIRAGRSIFNQHCAHCHAPNALSPEPSRDLRRLRRRYGERMAETFYATVTEGRPDKGMPPWKAVLDAESIERMWTFLRSIQAEP